MLATQVGIKVNINSHKELGAFKAQKIKPMGKIIDLMDIPPHLRQNILLIHLEDAHAQCQIFWLMDINTH